MSKNTPFEIDNAFNKSYIYENILLFRRKLRLSQKEFMSLYLKDSNGKYIVSAGTFSNFENGVLTSALKISSVIAEKLEIDPKIFELHPDNFAFNVDSLVSKSRESFVGILDKPLEIKKAESYTSTLVSVISDYLIDGIMCG